MKVLSIFCLVTALFGTSTFAIVTPDFNIATKQYNQPKATSSLNETHREKLGIDLGSNGSIQKTTLGMEDCLVSCSLSCATIARAVLTRCAGGVPTDPTCTTTMQQLFHQRSSTSYQQDELDALTYCARGGLASCATDAKSFLSRRRSTTVEQDVNQAVTYCSTGGLPSCLTLVYDRLSHRPDTSVDQDVNDSVSVCLGR